MRALIERLASIVEKGKDVDVILEFNESYAEMEKSGEFLALLDAFERHFKLKKPQRESRDMWPRHVYASGPVDNDFQSFLKGYSWGKYVESQGFK